MAGPWARRSPCRNLPPTSKDKLARVALEAAPINDSGTSSHISTVSRIPTPAPALPLAPAKLVAKYTNANL